MQLSTAEFWATFIAVVTMFSKEDLDPGNTLQENVKEEYDFIIVGGGTAGSVLASRLSEVFSWSVAVIEAGAIEDIVSNTPNLVIYNFNTEKDWNYTTVEQQTACLALDGRCDLHLGHVMGGTSSIVSTSYIRGSPEDYDRWAELGCTGWNYDEVLHYYTISENIEIQQLKDTSPYHGRWGYLHVKYPNYISPIADEFITAGTEFGLNKTDYNGRYPDNSIDYIQYTLRGPSRESTSKAYLLHIRERENLDIIQRARVSKILIENNVAKGVEYYRNGVRHTLKVRNEVIVSAGSIETAKLLLLSGIGPKDHLEDVGIPLVADLPVGSGLQDHTLVSLTFGINQPLTIRSDDWKTNQSIYAYAQNNSGPLTTFGTEVVAFYNPNDRSANATFSLRFSSFIPGDGEQHENLIRFSGSVLKPQSRGTVKLNSTSYLDAPLIDTNFYGEQIDYDTMKAGLRTVFEIINTTVMSKYSPEITFKYQPKCADASNQDDLLDCLINQYSREFFNPVSTTRMGRSDDKRTVVDPDLKVLNVDKLRVIDSAVTPEITRGTYHAPTIMIAEKGAITVKNSYPFKPNYPDRLNYK